MIQAKERTSCFFLDATLAARGAPCSLLNGHVVLLERGLTQDKAGMWVTRVGVEPLAAPNVVSCARPSCDNKHGVTCNASCALDCLTTPPLLSCDYLSLLPNIPVIASSLPWTLSHRPTFSHSIQTQARQHWPTHSQNNDTHALAFGQRRPCLLACLPNHLCLLAGQ